MLRTNEKLRIAIDINVVPGVAGGIVQSTAGLVSSLGQLDGPEQYSLITQGTEQAEWIRRYCGPNQHVVFKEAVPHYNGNANGNGHNASMWKKLLRPAVNRARDIVRRLSPQPQWPSVPVSDGYYESLGCDVLHFPTQWFALCAVPTIYNPHDLQHKHYPQFFSASELAQRETVYSAACRFSNTVVVGSEWIKQDVVDQYGVNPDKVQIIPWAPPTMQYPQITQVQLAEVKTKYNLPADFALYPAVTWPHKNHLRLLDALAELRDSRGLTVHLVCTGSRYPSHWPRIEQRIRELNLASQVKFLGFLPESDLRALYRLAQFLVLPTLFEADSCPIHEAWTEGLPVASADITALPDQVLDAGVLFDPKNVSAIADAMQRMATDATLRQQLRERGHERVKDFSWDRTARAFRAVYRRAAGCTLSDEDRWLLQWDWMREPRRQPEYQKS
jgi:glycosyltransferase involved in cell wall biosynthesis